MQPYNRRAALWLNSNCFAWHSRRYQLGIVSAPSPQRSARHIIENAPNSAATWLMNA